MRSTKFTAILVHFVEAKYAVTIAFCKCAIMTLYLLFLLAQL